MLKSCLLDGTPRTVRVRSLVSKASTVLWKSDIQELGPLALPIEQVALVAASRSAIAVTGIRHGKNGVLLVNEKGNSRFIERPQGLYGLEFDSDGRTLFLLGFQTDQSSKRVFTTTACDTKTGFTTRINA